jgi:hypothetical protein
MKQLIKLFAFITLISITFTSCEEDVKPPVISDVEVGLKNSKTAYVGADLHLEATIVAEGKISKIQVTIHPASEAEHVSAMKAKSATTHEDEWEVDTTYTKFSGLKNTTFHEHIDIPVNAEQGAYHLHIIVVDMEGNSTEFEEEGLTISAPVADGVKPTITISTAPTANQVFTTGQTITISGNITDALGLAGTYIGLVKVSQNLTDAQVSSSNTITLLHFHDFTDPKNYSFSASIQVGTAKDNDITPKDATWTAGEYYLVVKAPAVDGEAGFSAHYPVIIN